eukprot:10823578-Heterocapsa_arctica.AAC.1
MGHEVKTCGEYEYCLGCGRTTKAKRTTSANIFCWRRQLCKPVVIMRIYRDKNYDIIFEDWWTCTNCKAKGPQFNNIKHTEHSANNHITGSDDEDDEHDHNIRTTETEEDKPWHTIDYGIEVNKQARQTAK